MHTPAPPRDAIAAVTHADPYPWYAAQRAAAPLHFDPGLRLWIASRAEVVNEVLAHPALRVRPAAEPVPLAIAGTPAGELFSQLVRMNDGAPHAAHKPVLQRALAALDADAARVAARSVARRLGAQPLPEAMFTLPVAAVAHLLGFGDEVLPRVAGWVREFVACLSPLSSPGQLQAAGDAAARLMAEFEVLAAAQTPPQGSLLAALRSAAAPEPWPRALLANAAGLLSQTCEATAGLLGNSLVALALDEGLREAIATRPGLLVALVREVARHDPAVHNTRRFAAEPVTVAGTTLAPGDAVLVLLAAANRDPALNPRPDSFELERPQRRSLGFGHGPHACPGEALACAVATGVLEALLAQGLAPAALAARGWRYRPSVNARIPAFA